MSDHLQVHTEINWNRLLFSFCHFIFGMNAAMCIWLFISTRNLKTLGMPYRLLLVEWSWFADIILVAIFICYFVDYHAEKPMCVKFSYNACFTFIFLTFRPTYVFKYQPLTFHTLLSLLFEGLASSTCYTSLQVLTLTLASNTQGSPQLFIKILPNLYEYLIHM